MLTVKQPKQSNVFEVIFFWSQSQFYKKWKTLAIIQDFQTLIWRPGKTVQNLESPGLSGRVDSPAKLSFLYNYALFFCHVLLLHKYLGKNKIEKLDLHLCDLVITLIVIGIIAELDPSVRSTHKVGAPQLSKYTPTDRPPNWPSAPQEHQCLLSHFLATLIVIGIILLF